MQILQGHTHYVYSIVDYSCCNAFSEIILLKKLANNVYFLSTALLQISHFVDKIMEVIEFIRGSIQIIWNDIFSCSASSIHRSIF